LAKTLSFLLAFYPLICPVGFAEGFHAQTIETHIPLQIISDIDEPPRNDINGVNLVMRVPCDALDHCVLVQNL